MREWWWIVVKATSRRGDSEEEERKGRASQPTEPRFYKYIMKLIKPGKRIFISAFNLITYFCFLSLSSSRCPVERFTAAAFCTLSTGECQRSGGKGRGTGPYLRPRATGPAGQPGSWGSHTGTGAPHARHGVSGGDAEPSRLFCTVAASRQRWQQPLKLV